MVCFKVVWSCVCTTITNINLYTGAQDYHTYIIGVYQQNIFPGTLECSGMEASLLECENHFGRVNYCNRGFFLNVRCASE